MFSCRNKAFTILELIISIALVGVIVLGINGISTFSHNHVISSDRRAKLQNDVSLCLDHITKQGLRTIGNETPSFNVNTAVIANSGISLAFFIDADGNGRRELGVSDHWVRYTLSSNQLSYFSNCGTGASPACSGSGEVLSDKITAFVITKNFALGNHVEVQVSGRWDPAVASSMTNPEVTMSAIIQLPSVSTN